MVAELQRLPSVTSVPVGPLDPAAMAEHLLRLAHGTQDAAAIDRVIERAEGNAYFAEELLATSSVEGASCRPGLAELLLARTVDLSAQAQQVLRAAAVAGRRVDDELVTLAAGLSTAEYESAVRESVARQLLVPDGSSGLAFRHALLREAIYTDLLPGERTRLHARLAELLADERRLAGSGRARRPSSALHSLASHDIPGAFAASVQAGREAERLAAPAEAHRHFDQALSLWERVPEPEKLSGLSRGKLAFKSALSAADAGDVGHAVKQLRRMIVPLERAPEPDLRLLCRVRERLAYFLLDIDECAEALEVASAAVDMLPPEPPTWERARALATHARTILSEIGTEEARVRAEEAAKAANAANAPWVEADALATLSGVSERTGCIEDALTTSARAVELAASSEMEGVELRARTLLARIQLEHGDLKGASTTAHTGVHLAERTGLSMAPFGLDLQFLHYLAHYNDGDWDHAQQISDRFPVRVAGVAEARLSAMALFIDVARGGPRVAERRRWLEPYLPADLMAEYIAKGLYAEDEYWAGDLTAAVQSTWETIKAAAAWGEGYSPQTIRPAAVGIGALGDLARHARAAGHADQADGYGAQALELLEAARVGADTKLAIGVDGSGWLARAEAEYRRAMGDNDQAHWRKVLDTFAAGLRATRRPRSRWRPTRGTRGGRISRTRRQEQWLLAAEAA